MTPLPRCLRLLTAHRLFVFLIAVTMIAGAFPASAQTPVAYPPIKLIHLYQHTCPAGVDPLAGSLIDAANACPSAIPNVNFTLTSQDPSFAPQTHPTDSLGATEWHEVPSGFPYAIQQTVAAGYGTPVVRCQMGQNLQTGVNFVELTFSAPGGSLDIGTSDLSLTYFMDNACYWFDIPAGQTGLGSEAAQGVEDAVSDGGAPANTPTSTPRAIIDTGQVEGAEVAADTTETMPTPTPQLSSETGGDAAPQAEQASQADEAEEAGSASPVAQGIEAGGTRLDIRAWKCPFHFDAAVATVAELLANCQAPHRDANFIINGDPATQQYPGDLGSTSYQDVPFGTVTIQQLAYASYDPVRVFCYTQPFTAPHGPLQASQEIGFTEEPGDTFSVTLAVNPGDAIDCIWFDAWMTEDDLGSVLLHKYVCPDGTNTAAFDMDLLLRACEEPQVAYFELLFPGGSSAGNETDSNGYLGFINVGPGSVTIRETAPLGYAPARIFCRSYNADDWNHIVDPWVEQPIVNKSGMAVQIQANWEIECNWFDVKGLNYGYLDLTARSCPLTFAPTEATPRLTYAQQCQAGISGAMFELSSNANFDLSATSTDGYALFQEHVPVGYLSISSKGPQAYSVMKVFCGDAPFIGIGAIPTNWTPFNSGYVLYNVPLDYQVVCEYYFRPIAIVDTGVASPESDVSAADEDSSNSTGDEAAGVEATPVTVDTQESTSDSTSDNGTPLGGTGDQGSGSTTNQGSSSSNSGSDQGSTGGSTEPSQPAQDVNAPATLTLVAFVCPPGYDLYGNDAVPSDDCSEPAPGIDFIATGPDDTMQQATSNASGALAWADLAPGAYLIQAALPPETEQAFIADCASDQRTFGGDSPFMPFAFAGLGGQIGVTLLPGETLACSWYDIPAGKSGTVSAQLFACPGATVIRAQCTPGAGPATLTFEPADGESAASFDLQLDDDGTGQTTAQAGSYVLTGVPIDACLIESDAFEANGQMMITENAAIEIRIYTCGSG